PPGHAGAGSGSLAASTGTGVPGTGPADAGAGRSETNGTPAGHRVDRSGRPNPGKTPQPRDVASRAGRHDRRAGPGDVVPPSRGAAPLPEATRAGCGSGTGGGSGPVPGSVPAGGSGPAIVGGSPGTTARRRDAPGRPSAMASRGGFR